MTLLGQPAQVSALVAAEQPWAAQVSGDDPRFRLLLPMVRGMSLRDFVHHLLESPDVSSEAPRVAELVARLDDVRARVQRIEPLNIEDALADLLAEMVPERKRRNAISRRLGWDGKPPWTLAATGKKLGLTRERIRQVQSGVLKCLPKAHPVFLPALDGALIALTELAPMSDQAAMALTVERGYSKSGFHPAAIIATADALDREHPLQRSCINGGYFVTTQIVDVQVRTLSSVARKLGGATGAFSVFHTQRECAKLGANLDAERIRNVLGTIPGFMPLDSDRDWWRATGIPDGRDRLVNLSKKLLSVASPLRTKTILDGVARAYRGRAGSNRHLRDSLVVPPVAVLRSFFRHHEDFAVDGDLVSCRVPLKYKEHLGAAEQVLVEILQSCATGTLNRSTLARDALAKGVGEASFGFVTSFSPVLERVGAGMWKIRGVVIDPAAVAAVRQRARDVPRNPTQH